MPKRKNSDDELDFLHWKLKKIEKEIKKTRGLKTHSLRRISTSSDNSTVDDPPDCPPSSEDEVITSGAKTPENENPIGDVTAITFDAEPEPTALAVPEPAIEVEVETQTSEKTDNDAIDKELLDILGADPSAKIVYGAEIHKELASRLQHIATAGLTKEIRKELNDKFLVPANCINLGAPSLNAEIKAAVTDTVVKRDKGIESRQKQLASAISGLATLLNRELESKEKDNDRLKQLMDVCRILCDIQHAESVTRRNFAVYSLKRELKEHLINTKIDKTLFGENLAETLKSAKAVTKSGTELKIKPAQKPKPATSSNNNLNWKGPAPARKQPASGNRGREAAPPPAPGPSARYNRSATHASSSKQSQPPSKQTHRR